MSSFFSCAAYSDVETTIWLDEHVVFFALEDKENFDDEEYAWAVPKFICLKAQRIRIADSLDRKISEPTVTELIAGVRETYSRKEKTPTHSRG